MDSRAQTPHPAEPVVGPGPVGLAGPARLNALPEQRVAQGADAKSGEEFEVFAALAVCEREWAGLNPRARMRDPLTVDDVLSSRLISSPLRLLDICLVTDGGVACVVTSPEVAASLDRPPVYSRGYGDNAESQTITAFSDLTRPMLYRRAAEQAFTMAALGPEDVDLVYAYDPTTSFALWGLEEMGFAERGEGARLVESGALRPGGICLLSDQDRVAAAALRETLTAEGFTYTMQPARAGEPGGRRVKGTIYRIGWPASAVPP